jgi:hypothetical protein
VLPSTSVTLRDRQACGPRDRVSIPESSLRSAKYIGANADPCIIAAELDALCRWAGG